MCSLESFGTWWRIKLSWTCYQCVLRVYFLLFWLNCISCISLKFIFNIRHSASFVSAVKGSVRSKAYKIPHANLPAGREVAASPNRHLCISILATECGQSSFVVNILCNTLEELYPNNVFPDMSSKCWGLVTLHGIYYERVMAKSLAEMGTNFPVTSACRKGCFKNAMA